MGSASLSSFSWRNPGWGLGQPRQVSPEGAALLEVRGWISAQARSWAPPCFDSLQKLHPYFEGYLEIEGLRPGTPSTQSTCITQVLKHHLSLRPQPSAAQGGHIPHVRILQELPRETDFWRALSTMPAAPLKEQNGGSGIFCSISSPNFQTHANVPWVYQCGWMMLSGMGRAEDISCPGL